MIPCVQLKAALGPAQLLRYNSAGRCGMRVGSAEWEKW